MSLLKIIQEDKNLRKIFGKKELEIIERQLLGIKLTDSERIRLSRDIRKKLLAVKSLANYIEEFNLKKGAVIKEKVEEAKEEILNDELRNKIQEIWLFGSAVKNQLTFRSDIDIAVIFDNISEKEAVKFRIRILRNFGENIDIQAYNVLPNKIKEDILKYHKVLYKK